MPKENIKPSALSELGRKITNYIQAGYAGVYLVSPEEQRVEAQIKAVVDHLNSNQKEQYELCYWSVVDGLVNVRTNQVHSCNDPLDFLQVNQYRWAKKDDRRSHKDCSVR